MSSALRASLFDRVPPLINFSPSFSKDGKFEACKGEQYWDAKNWDQDHLWRIPIFFWRFLEARAAMEEAGNNRRKVSDSASNYAN